MFYLFLAERQREREREREREEIYLSKFTHRNKKSLLMSNIANKRRYFLK